MTLNWDCVLGSTFRGMRSGSMGSWAMLHFTQAGLVSPGSHSETRCPTAQVTMYCSPYRKPSPFDFAPITRAMSRATEGFSAMISFLDIVNLSDYCLYRFGVVPLYLRNCLMKKLESL